MTLSRLKERYLCFFNRLKNYERVLKKTIKDKKLQLSDDDIKYIAAEIRNTETLLALLAELIDYDFGSRPMDMVYRQELKIDERRLWHLFTNGVRLTDDEIDKVIIFVNR